MGELELMQQKVTIMQSEVFEIQITNPETYRRAGDLLVALKDMDKAIRNYFRPLKESAHKAWQSICKRETEELSKIKKPISYLNEQMTLYNIAEEKKRQEELIRITAELQKQEEARRLELAEQLEKAGNTEEAEAILTEDIFIPKPMVEKTTPKINGLTLTTTWKWRVIDANIIPREYLKIDEAKINSVVKALKDNANIPGIEVYPEQTMRGVRK